MGVLLSHPSICGCSSAPTRSQNFCIFRIFSSCLQWKLPSGVAGAAAWCPQGETGCGLRGNRHHHRIQCDGGGDDGEDDGVLGDGDDDGVRSETLVEMSCHDGAHTLERQGLWVNSGVLCTTLFLVGTSIWCAPTTGPRTALLLLQYTALSSEQ